MIKNIMLLALATSIAMATQPVKLPKKEEQVKCVGTFTATEYCRACNTPRGSTITASGRFVPGYSVATSEIPLGTIITVNGREYRVDDTGCPKGRIDFLRGSTVCRCNKKERIKVFVKNKQNRKKLAGNNILTASPERLPDSAGKKY